MSELTVFDIVCISTATYVGLHGLCLIVQVVAEVVRYYRS